jgi:hypothetical protein
LAYDGERADAAALDQLEVVLRHVMEELETWHGRALKAEAGGGARHDPEARARGAELEQENKQLRQRVDAARGRVTELLSRLTFLEDQARDPSAGGGGGGGQR